MSFEIPIPGVLTAELEETIRKLVREELAKLGRDGDEPSLLVDQDRRLFAACASLQGQRSAESELVLRGGYKPAHRDNLIACAVDDADLLLELLANTRSPAPRPKPPEEHVAPDTAGFTRREP